MALRINVQNEQESKFLTPTLNHAFYHMILFDHDLIFQRILGCVEWMGPVPALFWSTFEIHMWPIAW